MKKEIKEFKEAIDTIRRGSIYGKVRTEAYSINDYMKDYMLLYSFNTDLISKADEICSCLEWCDCKENTPEGKGCIDLIRKIRKAVNELRFRTYHAVKIMEKIEQGEITDETEAVTRNKDTEPTIEWGIHWFELATIILFKILSDTGIDIFEN